MFCLQAFLFVIELGDRDGFVSDCLYDDLGEGSGASPIPFLKCTGCYWVLVSSGCRFPRSNWRL